MQEPQGVGTRCPALSQPACELVFGKPEPIHESLVGSGGLERAQVLPLQVLHECKLHALVLAGLSDEDGHPVQACFLRRPQPSLTGYQLESAWRRAYDERLQDTDLAYGGGELLDPCLGKA